jgi:hypothetical protein
MNISGVHLNLSLKKALKSRLDYKSRIGCLNLTSLSALFVFLLCRRVVRSQLTLQRQL